MSQHNPDNALRQQLVALINGGNAHATFEDVLADLTFEHTGIKPANLPYSIWQLVEHIRIAQWDILEFSKNAEHQSPKWPDEYWPADAAPADEQAWKQSIQQTLADRDAFIALINNPAADLYTPFKHGNGQNLLREALLIADHASYHLGQIIIIRRLLNNWKG